jgi:hypothetical protein
MPPREVPKADIQRALEAMRREEAKKDAQKLQQEQAKAAREWLDAHPEATGDPRFRGRMTRIIYRYRLRKHCWHPMGIVMLAYSIYRTIYDHDGQVRVGPAKVRKGETDGKETEPARG